MDLDSNDNKTNSMKSNDARYGMLVNPGEEKDLKRNELKEVNEKVNHLYDNSESFKKLEIKKSNLKILSDIFQKILKSDEFSEWIKSEEISILDDLKSKISDFIDWIKIINFKDDSLKKLIEKNKLDELELFIRSKFELDKLLINI